MKHMKRMASLLMALVMALTLAVPVMAAEEKGSITINGVSAGNVYEIYKLLDLETYNKTSGAYSYKVNDAWVNFFKSDDAKKYFAVDENNYATWILEKETPEDVAEFAKLALAYAEQNKISPVKSTATPGDYTSTDTAIKFTGLDLGYYLIDSTMGALCGLTTTNPDASINAKNKAPTIDKQVKEDSTNQWGGTNTADIGQTVEFRTTINVHEGAQNYILHDKMSAGLTFVKVSKIEHVIPDVETHELALTTDYTVVTEGLDDRCTFEVRFTETFCDHLDTNDKVIVYYEATLNDEAVIAGDGNTNEAWLHYGDNHETTHDTTTTYTFAFDIVKTDGQNKLIDGAEFRIYDAVTGGNEVAVVEMKDEEGNVIPGVYRHASASEGGVNIVVNGGKVRVVGFDNGTYYLEETVTPSGYNQLSARQKFIISDGNLDATFNEGVYSTGSGVHVVNKTGEMLPETGGMGTTLFYVLGGVLVIGAGVALVTKKRMG